MPYVNLELYKDRGTIKKSKTFMSDETYKASVNTNLVSVVAINELTGRTFVKVDGYAHDVVGTMDEVTDKLNDVEAHKTIINSPTYHFNTPDVTGAHWPQVQTVSMTVPAAPANPRPKV